MYCTLKYYTQLGNLLSWICITVYTISVYMYCGVMTTWNLALVLEESWVRHWPLVSISISIAFLARREVVVLLFGVWSRCISGLWICGARRDSNLLRRGDMPIIRKQWTSWSRLTRSSASRSNLIAHLNWLNKRLSRLRTAALLPKASCLPRPNHPGPTFTKRGNLQPFLSQYREEKWART